ncbi:adrenocorticotropic hormone receptor-like [Oculina patagonica]
MSFQAGNNSLSHQQQPEGATLQQHSWQMIPLPSAILFTCLAPFTALGNGFLLLIFYKNSSTLLRTPSNFFIFSMAWANFLTGFVLQPLLAYRYYSLYLNNELLIALRKVMSAFSIVTMNASIFSVCAFSWDSFLALTRPIKHRKCVTVRRAKVAIACVWIYQIVFASLLFTNIPLPLVHQIDLHLNTTLISVLLLLCYVCLYKAFKQRERKRVRSFNSPRPQSSFRTSKMSTKMEKRMRMIIFLFTLVTTIPILPVTVVWYVTWYCSECQQNQQLVLAEKVLNQLVFVKFVLDPFVYAWRLERYRKALKKMICCTS